MDRETQMHSIIYSWSSGVHLCMRVHVWDVCVCVCVWRSVSSAHATLLTHAAQSSFLEGQHTSWLERLVGLSDGVGYLRRDAST